MALVIPEYLVVRHYLEAPVDQGTLFLLEDLGVRVNLLSEINLFKKLCKTQELSHFQIMRVNLN